MMASGPRYWNADGDLLRTTDDDPVDRLEGWKPGEGVWGRMIRCSSLARQLGLRSDQTPDVELLSPGALALPS